MDVQKVTNDLTAIFRDIFADPALRLERDTTADDVPGWDSARMVEIIIATEAHFGITFTTRETDNMRCVGDMIDLVARKAA